MATANLEAIGRTLITVNLIGGLFFLFFFYFWTVRVIESESRLNSRENSVLDGGDGRDWSKETTNDGARDTLKNEIRLLQVKITSHRMNAPDKYGRELRFKIFYIFFLK